MPRRPANGRKPRHFDLPTARRGRVKITLPDVADLPGDADGLSSDESDGIPFVDQNSAPEEDPYCRGGK